MWKFDILGKKNVEIDDVSKILSPSKIFGEKSPRCIDSTGKTVWFSGPLETQRFFNVFLRFFKKMLKFTFFAFFKN